MFGAAALLRILIAPHAGAFADLKVFQDWAIRLADVGLRDFYAAPADQFLSDYPPPYLYVLWVVGKVSAVPGYLLLKLPAILADLGLAWVAGTLAERLAPAALRERVPVRTLVAAAVLFNPAVIALSAVWGQVDSVPALFVLSSLLLLFTGRQSLQREVAAFLLYAVAIAMKPQAGFVLPVMLYALYRRYFHRRPPSEWLDGAIRVGASGALSLGLVAISGLPFGLGPVALVRFYEDSASVYPVTSANAFNLWGALASWRNNSLGADVLTIAGISALHVGVILFVAAAAFALWRAHRAIERGGDDGRVLMVTAAIVSLLAYTLLTRMHERYMFVSLACLSPLIFVRQIRLAFAALSTLFVLDLWFAYGYLNALWRVEDFAFQPWFGWLFGELSLGDTWQKRVWSLAVVAVAMTVAWFGVRWAARAGAGGAAASASSAAKVRQAREAPPRTAAPPPSVPPSVPPAPATRWAPLVLVALSCVFCLVVLRAQVTPAQNLNDSAFHLQMVRWASGQIEEGRLPLDGWFPWLSLGSSQFHHYQSLPHTLTAYVARIAGAGDQSTYVWLLYLLLALWPAAVYWGARLLGWSRWTAAGAAAVAPLIASAPGYGYEHGSYTWQGFGVYSQLWAMWLLPLSWGLTWRAVSSGRYYAAAAAATALTIACHFITAYLALMAIGVWVIVLGGGYVRRIGRAALVAAGSLVVASWVLVPLLADAKWSTRSEYYQGRTFNDSYGARRVLGWLFTGELFDSGRFPIVTLLVFAGIVVCAVRERQDPRARALLGVFVLSLFLFFGRRTFGSAIDLIPGFEDVQIHRFIMGVHLSGIVLAGVALGWVLRAAANAVQRAVSGELAFAAGAAAAAAVAIVLLAPAWTERRSEEIHGDRFIREQRIADATDERDLDRLVAIVKSRGDGRVYAGLRGNWGLQYVVGRVPVNTVLANRDVDAIGFTFRTIASLSNDVEAAFDESNPAQYEMLNVRYLILPPEQEPRVPARLIATAGRHRLFEVAGTGYFQVVDRSPAIEADRTDVQRATLPFRSSQLAARGIYPGVAFAGGPAPAPTFTGATPPAGSAGRVVSQSHVLEDGFFRASVDAARPAVALLKATYDRRWHATVDGLPAKAEMMAPSLVGVEIPAGRHVVEFKYEPYGAYPLLLTLGALTLLALALFPRRDDLRRRLIALRESRRGHAEPVAPLDTRR